jgi:predicted nucleic acid-binding protein
VFSAPHRGVLSQPSGQTRDSSFGLARFQEHKCTFFHVLIEDNIVKPFTVVALTAKEYVDLVMKLGREGILGGQAYDALHLRCAEKAGVDRIHTFDARHFGPLAPRFSGKNVVP